MLKGKVALVTGSTSGIGLGIARALAAEGADIVLNGFGDAGAIEKLRAGLESEFKCARSIRGADMSKPAEIESMVKEATAKLGRVDILVNNAGIQHVSPIQNFPPEKWDAVIAINLSSAFHAIRAALPQMLERNWGRIINIASAHGLVASVDKSPMSTAKHGLVGLTKVVALETAKTGVTCNAICPGWVLTPLVQTQIDARAEARRHPGREGEARSARREAAVARIRDARTARRPCRVPVLGCGRADCAASDRRWTAAGPRIELSSARIWRPDGLTDRGEIVAGFGILGFRRRHGSRDPQAPCAARPFSAAAKSFAVSRSGCEWCSRAAAGLMSSAANWIAPVIAT